MSYFKPALAKRLCGKYLSDAEDVFCPFNGFSGIMLGCAVGCGKKFVGRDLNKEQIRESMELVDFLKAAKYGIDVDLAVADVFGHSGKYDTMFCCPPYEALEQWNFDENGVCVDRNLPCEDWISVCLERYSCRKYLFVVDDRTVGRYSKYIVEKIENRSHFGKNSEYVVYIG